MGEFENLFRLGVFFGVFVVVATWEALAPRRRQSLRRYRWPHNIGLLLVDVLFLRVVAPGAAVAVAITAEAGKWGLLNTISLPAWIAIPLAVTLLDLAIYVQHVMF